MVRPKVSSKKKSARGSGVDFKKFKRKLGRKLPPPKNTTNTEIKAKEIILPEQTVAAKKGPAVNKKGLTLKELLGQTSHYNPKVRKDALVGIQDLFHKFPEELQLHKLAVVEKLRERISDPDKLVREALYTLFELKILPICEEDNQGVFSSLLVAYVFNAMAHLSLDVRLMSFKFLKLVVQRYPPTFSLNAEKILQGYEDIFRKNQLHLLEKGKIEYILSGLGFCLSLLPSHQREDGSSHKATAAVEQVLHAYETDVPRHHAGNSQILEKLKGLLSVLVNCFNDLVSWAQSQRALHLQTSDFMLSVLQCVDSVVRYYLYAIEKHVSELKAEVNQLLVSNASMHDEQLPPILEKLFTLFPIKIMGQLSEKEDDRYLILNIRISEIFLNLSQLSSRPTFLEKFLEFIESLLSRENFRVARSQKALYEKHVSTLIACLPQLLNVVDYGWKARLLQAFTTMFRGSCPHSAIKMACVTVAEELLLPRSKNSLYLDADDVITLEHKKTWMRQLPMLLVSPGDVQASNSEAVLRFLLRLGQFGFSNPELAKEYDGLQCSLQEFFGTWNSVGTNYGSFLRLPKATQEVAISCIYYFSFLDSRLLESLASCCLCRDLEPYVLFRIIEVLHSAYKAGHLQMADQISFFVTLVAKFEVNSGQTHTVSESETKISRQAILRRLTGAVCASLSQMGDLALVFEVLEKIVLDTMSLELHVDNKCALLRMLAVVDSSPTRFSKESIARLSELLFGYLMAVVMIYPNEECVNSNYSHKFRYYLLTCYLLFGRSTELLKNVLSMLETQQNSALLNTQPSRRIALVVSVFLMLSKDDKVRGVLTSCRDEMHHVMQSVLTLESKEEANMSIEHRHRVKCAVEQLRSAISVISP